MDESKGVMVSHTTDDGDVTVLIMVSKKLVDELTLPMLTADQRQTADKILESYLRDTTLNLVENIEKALVAPPTLRQQTLKIWQGGMLLIHKQIKSLFERNSDQFLP